MSHTVRPQLALLALAAGFAACGGGRSGPEPVCAELRWEGPRPGTNLVLIVDDTMRRDRVGAYGGPARTPAFDLFGTNHLLFEHASSQAPWTKPSVATLFTSLYPSQHGVLDHPPTDELGHRDPSIPVGRTSRLSADLVTLAELLRGAGYHTAAIVSNPWLGQGLGFEQGFDYYDDSLSAWGAPGEAVAGAALRWLDERENDDQPFFLYLHFMDSHRPYRLSRWDVMQHWQELQDAAPADDADTAEEIASLVFLQEGPTAAEAGLAPSRMLLETAYDRGIERFDEALAMFLVGFAPHPARSRTAIVVTSDHGEALFERGYGNHGGGLYDDELGIPLAAELPGVSAANARVGCPAGLIDLLPTLCDYLGIDCPAQAQGVSLLGSTGPAGRRRYLVAEGVRGRPLDRAIRDRKHKLILAPEGGPDGKRRALFDIAADPGELDDLLLDPSDEAERIADKLTHAALGAVAAFPTPEGDSVPIDAELEQRLRALGYLR